MFEQGSKDTLKREIRRMRTDSAMFASDNAKWQTRYEGLRIL